MAENQPAVRAGEAERIYASLHLVQTAVNPYRVRCAVLLPKRLVYGVKPRFWQVFAVNQPGANLRIGVLRVQASVTRRGQK